MESHKEKWLLSGKKSKSYQNHKLQQNAKKEESENAWNRKDSIPNHSLKNNKAFLRQT